jgi:hypothetical protein
MAWSGETMWVHPIGTHRRLQGLAVLGWTLGDVSRALGMSTTAVEYLRTTDRRMLASTAAKVTVVYADLSYRQAPVNRYSNRCRNHARRSGWVAPLAWDDDTIDDPAAAPNTGAPVGRPSEIRAAERAGRIEDIEFLVAIGHHIDIIARRLNTTSGAIEQVCRRAGRYDLYLSIPGHTEQHRKAKAA